MYELSTKLVRIIEPFVPSVLVYVIKYRVSLNSNTYLTTECGPKFATVWKWQVRALSILRVDIFSYALDTKCADFPQKISRAVTICGISQNLGIIYYVIPKV